MKVHSMLIVRLKGGLGNQMFQYASAAGIASKWEKKLIIDDITGFARDRVYKRKFGLQKFGLSPDKANFLQRAVFLIQVFKRRFFKGFKGYKMRVLGGTSFEEIDSRFYPELLERDIDKDLYMDGYWQSEEYFSHISRSIYQTFKITAPTEGIFTDLAQDIDFERSIAIGVRLYEEAAPGAHDTEPLSWYERAVFEHFSFIDNPVYYIFCTVKGPIDSKFNFKGEVRYITHDDGYIGELQRLWLLTRFKYHVLSNSSFYWWGAWIAEKEFNYDVKVVASALFPNPSTIPDRWIKAIN